jgi:phthiocerol/phenolphthiocerol synthesis type-I polyketide synthase A
VGLELSATMLFNHPTVDTFATYLAQQLVPDLDVGGDDEVADDDAGDSLLDSLFDSVESN